MKLGVFTVSSPEYYPLELMDKLAEIGYDGIEWRVAEDNGNKDEPSFWQGNRAGMTAEELIQDSDVLIEKAEKLNLSMPSLGAYIDCFNLEKVEKHFQAANAIGSKNIRINPARYSLDESYASLLDKTRKHYAEVATLAAKYNVRACIETHMGIIAPSMFKTMAILEGLNPENVGIMWDPANQIVEGLERFDMAMDIAGNYLAEVHAKNMCYEKVETDGQIKWQAKAAPLDEGQVDWKALINILKEKNYDGWIFLEDFSTDKSTDEKLVHNYQYFKNML